MKISDFGFAKLIQEGRCSFTQTAIRGTEDWMAPEWETAGDLVIFLLNPIHEGGGG